jgi:SAM-dependent methyltransferase
MTRAPQLLVGAGVAAVLFLIAVDGGSYSLESRNSLALVIWWAILLRVGLPDLMEREPVSRAGLATAGFLVVVAVWTLLSLLWAESSEKAFNEFNRVTLYLGVFLFAVLFASRRSARTWIVGLAVASSAIGLLALVSRLHPDPFPTSPLPFIGADEARLNYPLYYWNGLAVFVALGLPLLLFFAASRRVAWPLRGAALAVMPALAAVLYLTSSRGGTAVAVLGLAVFVLLTRRALVAALALALAAAASAILLKLLTDRPALVDRPTSAAAESEAASFAPLLVGVCLLAGVVYAVGCRFAPELPRVGPWPRRVATGLVIATAVAGVVAASPDERLEEFKNPPAAGEETVQSHLISASGRGRWQWWVGALDMWREEPVRGLGAGAYESWWSEHGTIAGFVRDAHSLYLETLAELGAVGFLLLVAALATPFIAAFRRFFGPNADRSMLAALIASLTAFAVEAGIDWMWEMTAVSVFAFVCAGLLVRVAGPAAPVRRPTRRVTGALARVGAAVAVSAILLAQLVPLLRAHRIDASQYASERGDGAAALEHALEARQIQPWAASPYLQLALVDERLGELRRAHTWITQGIERDRVDWRLWLVRARLEARLGQIPQARRSLDEARRLNPRSPLFASA